MTEQIRVAIVEDQRVHHEHLKKDLEYIGCLVMAVATNMVEVLDDLIPRLEELGITFVFLDNTIEENGDGFQIAKSIRESSSSIVIIGFSSSDQDYVDRKLSKAYMGFEPLKKVLANR
jgi:DNA-binding LytR/AlgR family response regulator